MKIKSRIVRQRDLWGAHAPSRAEFGALAEMFFRARPFTTGKVRDREDAIASTRGACAP